MIKLLAITNDKIIYEQTADNQPPEIKFHKILRDTNGNIDPEQFCGFGDGFSIGTGQVYGRYLYYLSEGGLYRADTDTEQLELINTDAKRYMFCEDYIVLMKKEERWKNYIITPPETKEKFFCNLFSDGDDESIFN